MYERKLYVFNIIILNTKIAISAILTDLAVSVINMIRMCRKRLQFMDFRHDFAISGSSNVGNARQIVAIRELCRIIDQWRADTLRWNRERKSLNSREGLFNLRSKDALAQKKICDLSIWRLEFNQTKRKASTVDPLFLFFLFFSSSFPFFFSKPTQPRETIVVVIADESKNSFKKAGTEWSKQAFFHSRKAGTGVANTIEILRMGSRKVHGFTETRGRLIGDEASAWMRPSFDQGQLCHSFVTLHPFYVYLSFRPCVFLSIYLSLSLYFYSHLLFAPFCDTSRFFSLLSLLSPPPFGPIVSPFSPFLFPYEIVSYILLGPLNIRKKHVPS